jgi:DNA mismatch repair protein MutL
MGSQAHIQVLPIHVANKIAAGEVVERPASVAKELIENAMDAAATQIDVELTAGGRKLVAINDNGSGMNRDDAILSIERQATSKIRDVDDIEHIATLGFRGEALAAIASVSRFRLVTCAANEAVGTELLVTGGKLQDVRDIGSPAGTRVEVRDLFFNVPARRKFLRSQDTELSYLRLGFMVQALSHPAVGMSLTIDGREAFRLPAGGNLGDRVRDLFGADYAAKLRTLQHAEAGVEVSGHAGLPSLNRTDRNEQYVFINGRAATAPVISHALREGYHTLLPGDRQPCVFLFLKMDTGEVDVNVHPTKREVRFRRSSDVRDAVIHAIRKALGHPGIRGMETSGSSDSLSLDKPEAVSDRAAELRLKIDNLPVARAFRYPGLSPLLPAGPGRAETLGRGNDTSPEGASPATGGGSAPGGGISTPGYTGSPWAWCRVVGQVGNLYVILETEDGYVVMDPHAAHERVLFEKFMGEVTGGQVKTQGLLLPETVELAPGDAMCVRKNLDIMRQMGFGVSEFGQDAFIVDALPSHFAGISPEGILRDVANALELAGTRRGQARWREESIAQAACKAAVKARDRLTLEEIEKLVVSLAGTEMPYTCPHGRPTLVFTSFRDLHKKFGRE